MSGLLILGAGGHGRVVADAARLTGRWTTVAFLDDRHADLGAVDGLPVLGSFAASKGLVGRYRQAVAAVGDNRLRLQVLKVLRKEGFELPSIIHPGAIVGSDVILGEGTVVLAQSVINVGARLAEGCIVNTGATVDHECVIGRGVHLSPGVHLGGNVIVGDRTWLGVGAVVRNGVTIGKDVMVGVGAAVIDDLPDGVTAVGVPARVVGTS